MRPALTTTTATMLGVFFLMVTGLGEQARAQSCPRPVFQGAAIVKVAGSPTFVPQSVTTGDFNGDGALDVASAGGDPFSQSVSVLLGDGQGGFAAAVSFPVSGAYSVTTADLNGDGALDLAVANGLDAVHVLLGDGQGGFATAVSYHVPFSPISVTTGDFNGDGALDLATAAVSDDTVLVLLGDGQGGFAAAVSFPVGVFPFSVATGDFNGDGALDLASANASANFSSGNVSVLLGDGVGGFAPAVSYGVGERPVSVTTGDFNGDGALDLATANSNDHTVSVLLGDGQGGFAPAVSFPVGATPLSVTAGDVNGDGALDLASATAGAVSVLLGNGLGGFAAAVSLAAGDVPRSVTTGDFNGDGALDLAAANDGSSASTVSVLLGNGLGGFAGAVSFAVGTSPQSVTTGDFNGDGALDLATANASGSVSVLLGDGEGGFAAAVSYPVGTSPRSVTTGDVNGDGNLDLATANVTTLSVLLGDGQGGFAPAVSISINGNPQSITTGDFNGDGDLDLATATIGRTARVLMVLLGDGQGGFAAPVSFPVTGTPLSVTTGDFNGDGALDLASASGIVNFFTPGHVSVLLGDGLGGFAAAVAFPVGGDARSVTTGDFNGDGALDLATADFDSGSVSVLLGDGQGGFAPVVSFGVGAYGQSVTTGDFNGDGALDLATATSLSNRLSVLLNLCSSDVTPPIVSPTVSGTPGTNGWYTSDVTVSWSVTDPESAIVSEVGCDAQTVTIDTSGVTFTCSATSGGGTSTSSVTVKRDASAPVLAPAVTPDPVVLHGAATASANATDALSGIAAESCAAVTTATVGAHTVACTATDQAGNTAAADAAYQVIYDFAGFFAPVANLPTVNVVKAGGSIPVQFSLGGNQGLAILAAGSPASSAIACDAAAPGNIIDLTLTAGNSGLQYDATTGEYTYVWKTNKVWEGTCRMLMVRFNDGTEHLAKFQFR